MIHFFDTETTGTGEGDRVIEVAVLSWRGDEKGAGVSFRALYDPRRDVPPESSGVHGYRLEDLAAHPPFSPERAVPLLQARGLFVAHNADFDVAMLNRELAAFGMTFPDEPVLDTLRLARKIVPDLANHKLGTLHHFFLHPRDRAPSHDALQDCLCLEAVWRDLVWRWMDRDESDSLADLLRWTYQPIMPREVTFGKCAGKSMREVPGDYLAWWLFKRPLGEANSDSDRWTWAFGTEWLRRAAPGERAMEGVRRFVDDALSRLVTTPFRVEPHGDESVLKLLGSRLVRQGGGRFVAPDGGEISRGIESDWVATRPGGSPSQFARLRHAADHLEKERT